MVVHFYDFIFLAPYFVSFCSLGSIVRSKHRVRVASTIHFILLTPLSLPVLMLIDFVWMAMSVIRLLLLSLLLFVDHTLIRCFGFDTILSNTYYLDPDKNILPKKYITHMEMKGYRRLRTLSQLLFETVPQTILQFWIIVRNDGD